MINLFKKKVKVGIAFGGGGARGFSHLGAIKAFEEYGIKFDYIAGTSAGSVFGAAYASGMTFKEIYKVAKNLKIADIRTNGFLSFTSKTDGIEKLVVDTLGDIDIKDLKTPFSAVAVNMKTTNQVCISSGNLAKAVAGSCCVPGFFTPVIFGDKILCDGGLQNTIPANIPRHFGCDYVVSIDCNSTRTYGTESTKLLDVLGCSIRVLMKSNASKGLLCSDLVVSIDNKRFKSTKLEGLDEMIDEGYKATIDAMPQIIKIFQGKVKKKKFKNIVQEEIEFV